MYSITALFIMKIINILLLLFINFYALVSCKHETITPVDNGHSYYPSNVGHWIKYDVDSTYYDGFNHTVRKYHFVLNEKIESTYLDNQNRPTQRIERYVQKNDSSNWYLRNVWASNLTSTTAEKVEENNRFVKLIFPIAEGQSWNGNAFNTITPMNYQYINVFKPYTVNSITFDSTITVIQDFDTNAISIKNMLEVYAKHVGMIYKQIDTVYKYLPPNIYPDSFISGVKCTYKIIGYGN